MEDELEKKCSIYTDWANHYLEKARNKRFISDLQQDVSDGVLLADVIEAVTNEKIREIKSKPKNTAQMVENINTCLTFLTNLGVSVEGLSAKDIKDGNLKAILGLFFSLSRFKQQQKTQHKQEHSKAHSGETTHQGSSKNQLNGGEMQSRLPSPFKSGNSRCPTITNPSTKPVSSTGGKSKSSTDKHLNQQNNNTQSATLPSGSSLNPAKASHPSSRATSPAVPGSGIPTPGGRSLTTPRPSGEKQPRAVSTGSTTSTSSTASNKSTSQKTVPPNKNSMLDKFKFFNSKDKSKGKGGVPKSTSKTSTGSTASTSSSSLALSSDRDSRTSCDTRSSTASARSSSSTDPGALSFSPETESPKLPPKTKSLGKPAASKKEHPSTLPLTHSDKHHSSSASHHGTSSSAVKKSSSKTDLKTGQKGSKIGTLIPKTASKSSKSASSTPTSTGIPTPTSIPKPSSSKSRSKDEKSKSHSQSSSAATSPSVSGIPSSKLSHQSGVSAYGSSSSHGKQHYESISDQSKTSVHEPDKMLHAKGRYTEIDYSEGKIDRVGEGQYSKNNLKMAAQQSGGPKISNKEGISPQTVNIVKPTCSVANTQMHAMSGMTDLNNQSTIINRALPPPLPKTEPPPRSNTPMKEHTTVPSQKDGTKNDSPSSPPGQGSISGHKSDSTSSSSSHSGPSGNNSNSSTESVIYRPSDSGSDVGSISATNSPRLGLKVLQPQQPINKSANNVAIVQPRHGEKVETTFDSEVRTKTVNKQNDKSSKETTFSEKETTFVDDSGEAMDIKPMQPLLRSMPYGTGYLRGYSNPGGKIFHNPGYATPTAAYFASTSRLGMNRPLMDHGKFYSGPIRKTPSSGLNSSFDGDYSSDYESFDYISGYMSDGDILKGNNKVEDMNCGYMSEGGASLYARRLQQRFREGMQAVKECMQKNTGMIDDDSFDDSSSISSGEISDAVNEISTDDGNLTGGSSQSDHTNPYSSLKRAPQKDVRQGPGQFPVKRAPNLGTSAFMGSDYGGESGPISGWRKYSLPQTNRLLSSDPADYAYLYNNYEHLHSWRTNQANQLRKLSNVSQPEIHHYRRHSDDYANSETSNKRDSETNTEQSHLLESSMRRMQQGRPGSGGSLGQGIYGYRRPTSNTSTSSAGSGKGEEVTKSSTIGSRLAKHTIDANGNRSSDNGQGIPRPGSAQALRCTTPVTDSYASSTLERRKKGSISSLKTSNSVQTDSEIYKSNTLGRTKKAFGNGMGKGPSQVHGSNLSLVSSASSHYSTAEEKQNAEVRKLRRELEAAQEKVSTLTTQLSTNAHVVAAFEQSLSNMTHRLQHLTSTANQKDSELTELRTTIEALKRQSGLNIPDPTIISPNVGRRHTSPGMVAKVDIHSSPNHQTHQHNQHHHHHHHTQGGRAFHTLPMPAEARITRQMSSDSVSSINSLSSACSMTSQQSAATDGDAGKGKKKKKGWLRSSFSKAFAKKKNRNGSMSDCEMDIGSLRSNASAPNSPLMQVHMTNGPSFIKGSHSSGAIYEAEDVSTVLDLRKQLRDKDMKLTDTRLEALSSAHQLEQLRETMTKMKNEMSALKADNDRLHRMMTSRGLNSSQSSLHIVHSRTNSDSLDRSLSITEQPSLEMLLSESQDREGKRVTMTVYLGSKPNPFRMTIEVPKPAEVLIGSLSVSGKTKWDILDNIVRKILKEYVLRVDPVTNLGLSAESVFSYHIGEIMRTKDAELPELLPIGYLVGETMQIGICLKGTKQNSVDSLAFETLIPKSIVQRYVSLLLEHRRIILCGPSGTGKTYLAQKLAEHLVLRSGKELTAGSVATFNVDHKTAKELRQYLANIADQCENSGAGELPSVIILDNLHHVGSLGEVFNGFLSVKYQKCPYIIGTMNQATCSTTNLQLHHNFRWVLCANHMEPVKGFLGRFLRRKLVEAEVRTGIRNNDLNKIIDWIPKVWLHINKFLETHSSSDVTIGPRLFLTCPMDITASQIWFIDLWNYSIIPYMLEAVREGLQVYGRRAPWEDPTDWIMETYPWAVSKEEDTQLLRIRQEDVGYDTPGIITSTPQPKTKSSESATENGDQLLNMIKRLQEAANYSSQSQDDDSASIDSHNSSIQEISISSIDSTS